VSPIPLLLVTTLGAELEAAVTKPLSARPALRLAASARWWSPPLRLRPLKGAGGRSAPTRCAPAAENRQPENQNSEPAVEVFTSTLAIPLTYTPLVVVTTPPTALPHLADTHIAFPKTVCPRVQTMIAVSHTTAPCPNALPIITLGRRAGCSA
jgi:hypothetical protein